MPEDAEVSHRSKLYDYLVADRPVVDELEQQIL